MITPGESNQFDLGGIQTLLDEHFASHHQRGSHTSAQRDPSAASVLAPATDWAGVRGIGNVLRHSYDDLDTRTILDVLQKRLDPLKDACNRARETLASEGWPDGPPS